MDTRLEEIGLPSKQGGQELVLSRAFRSGPVLLTDGITDADDPPSRAVQARDSAGWRSRPSLKLVAELVLICSLKR